MAANSRLRAKVTEDAAEKGIKVYIPDFNSDKILVALGSRQVVELDHRRIKNPGVHIGEFIDIKEHQTTNLHNIKSIELAGRIDVGSDVVDVEVAGPVEPPPIEPLAQALADEFEQDVEVSVRWIEERVERARGTPGEGAPSLFP